MPLMTYSHLNHHCTLDTFLEKFASIFVNAVNAAGSIVGVGGAAAGAVQLRPAVLAVRSCIGVAGTEFILNFRSCHAVPDIAQAVIRIAYELVAREQFAPRGNCHIFGTGATSCDSLVDARSVL